MKRKFSRKLVGTLAIGAIAALAVPWIALASSVGVSVVDTSGAVESVTLEPGQSAGITINLAVTGNQEGTATFKVYQDWTLSGGTFTGSNPKTFEVLPRAGGDPATTFTTSGTVSVASTQPVADKPFPLSVGAFDITNSNEEKAKLEAGSSSNYKVTVQAPTDPCASVSAPAVPTISSNPATADGSGGWFKTVPTVSASSAGATITYATEVNGGTKSVYSPTAPTLSQGNTTVYAKATSATCDKSSESSATFKVDTQAPTVVDRRATSPPDGAGGWYKTAVTNRFEASDAWSGFTSPTTNPYIFTQSSGTSEGSAVVIPSGSVSDVAGNTHSGINSAAFKIDLSAPTNLAFSAGISDGSSFDFGTVPSAPTCTADDAISSLASCAVTGYSSAVGSHTLTATATDKAGNSSTKTLSYTVTDPTPPVIIPKVDGTLGNNGWYTSDVTVSWDVSDNESAISSMNSCGPTTIHTDTTGLTLTCSATSAGGTHTSSVTIKRDATAPTINLNAAANACSLAGTNSWCRGTQTAGFTASDATSGLAAGTPANFTQSTTTNGSEVLIGSGSVSDAAGNTNTGIDAGLFKIDSVAPTNLTFNVDASTINGGASYDFGKVPPAPTCTADDAGSGLALCNVTGYSSAVGHHTLTATATDKAGNSSTKTLSYTVLAWTLGGFYKPVEMTPLGSATVWNTVKNGSTVPLKFEVFQGTTELTDTAVVQALSKQVNCGAGTEDTVEVLATGGTSLRYDTASGQFIYNWQTPKRAGTCYEVTVTTADGSSLTAYFKLK